jgi:flavin reductase (DIM6/NTAB) family NADH-FMN oxidoreductase RutF
MTSTTASAVRLEPVASRLSLDVAEFRRALGHFATGVAVVTTLEQTGAPVGLTLSSFNTVSLDPPLVLFSVDRKARSLVHLLEAEGFAINILHCGQEQISNRFARSTASKWDGVDHAIGESGAPLLPGSLAQFECRRYAHHDGGDHVIFIGEVVRFRYDQTEAPLIFYRGRYRSLSAA